ncbi:MAG: S8 family serine peptidase [Candidatus Methanofastidiosia archaeon]|jgi:subtilisin family serine protease
MTKKRIIAHFMHGKEADAAREKMTHVEETESFLIGEIEEEDIVVLEQKGLIIQVLKEMPTIETMGSESELGFGIKTHRRGPKPSEIVPEPKEVTENVYLIQLWAPLIEKWRKQFDELGVSLLEYVPGFAYTAKLTFDQVNHVNELPFVTAVRLYGPEDTGPVTASARAAGPPVSPATGRRMLTYDIRLHREKDLEKVQQRLKDKHVNIAGAKGRKIRLYVLEDSPLIYEIAAYHEVAVMEEYISPKLFNDVARKLLGIDEDTPNLKQIIPQTGKGEIVAVADTGLDDAHPDFKERIVGLVALGRLNDASDPHGHGTHVAGSVLGDGSASGGKIRGTAPEAHLFFQSLMDYSGGLGGLPLNLGDLFEEAYQAGARIHNNSWGAATQSMYTINSIEVDEFVAKRRDMLIIIAAGNEGQGAKCLHCEPGYLDWLSIGSPASSKNTLTVGASRSRRTKGGYAEKTYGEAWPQAFPESPIAEEKVSGNPEGLAAFSSRGPCDDRRIKPDVVAPGTDIVSAKSSKAPLRNFWGSYPGNRYYAYMGGTSMAAPLAAGCCALIREYYTKDRDHTPSAALVKATLINSTRWITNFDAVADHPDMPNYHQGFGCINMVWAIPNESEPWFKLEFVDTWDTKEKHFVRTGQKARFRFSIEEGDWLRICLVYTDAPGRALQNNLNLFVEHEQTASKWIGNPHAPKDLKIPDPDNNIEVVRLENPPPGDYLIQISARNLLRTPQDYALVVTGALTSPLIDV